MGNRLEKIMPRWEYGVFVGVRRRSGEVWVATKEGVWAVRPVRRLKEGGARTTWERRWEWSVNGHEGYLLSEGSATEG